MVTPKNHPMGMLVVDLVGVWDMNQEVFSVSLFVLLLLSLPAYLYYFKFYYFTTLKGSM